MKNRGLLVFLGLLLIGSLVFSICAAPARAAPYYKGKTVKIIVPYSPGGTFDAMARFTAKFMPKHIAGEPTIIVQNMPGGGGMIAARTAYKAKPDGLTVLHFVSALAFQAVMGKGKDVDFARFGYLGSVGGAHYVLFMRSELPYRSIEELRRTQKPIKIGVLGKASTITGTAKIARHLAGLNFKLVQYKGFANIALAIRQGEMDGVHTAAVSLIANPLAREMLEEKFATLVASLGGAKPPKKLAPVIDKLPYLRDHIVNKDDLAAYDAFMGTFKSTRLFAAPPGTPPEQLKILRGAFRKMQRDEQFITAAEKRGFVLYPVGHEETAALIKSMGELPRPVKQRLQEVFK